MSSSAEKEEEGDASVVAEKSPGRHTVGEKSLENRSSEQGGREEEGEGGTCFGGAASAPGRGLPASPTPPPFFFAPASASSIQLLMVFAFRRSCAAPCRTSRRIR